MSLSNLLPRESDIIIESLLLNLQAKNNELKKVQERAFDDDVSASIMSRFLVEKHPELTSEFATFTLEAVRKNGYGAECIASGGLAALEYHRDSISNKDLDDAISSMREMAARKS